MNNLSDFLKKIANRWTFLMALTIYLPFGLYIMPEGMRTIQEVAGKKVEVLDLQFNYNASKVESILSEYNEEARFMAARFNAIADSLYPVAYTFLYIILTAWVYNNVGKYRNVWKHIHLLPLSVMLIDYAENSGIIYMLRHYPNYSKEVPLIFGLITSFKWLMVGVVSIVVLAGIAILIYYQSVNDKSKKGAATNV